MNIEHRTFKVEQFAPNIRRLVFDVRCSTFFYDVCVVLDLSGYCYFSTEPGGE